MPSLLLQTCLIYQHGLLNADVTAVPIGFAITQLIVAGTTIALTTLVLSMPTSGIIAAAPAPQPPPPLATSSVKCADEEKMITAFPSRLRQKEERGCSGHQCIITAVRSSCLLWCRTVAVGVFMTEFHVWTLVHHFIVARPAGFRFGIASFRLHNSSTFTGRFPLPASSSGLSFSL